MKNCIACDEEISDRAKFCKHCGNMQNSKDIRGDDTSDPQARSHKNDPVTGELEPKTSFKNQCKILSEVWEGYRFDEEFEDFASEHNLAIALAVAASRGLAKLAEEAESIIEEAFDFLLGGLAIEDRGFEDFETMLNINPYTQEPY